jgi:UPF0271 protein
MKIKLNCDMGESFGAWKMGEDELIMPYVDLANLACGFHASDPITMNRSVKLAKGHDVLIGAHPAYQDLVGFGRRSMNCSSEEIENIVLYQLGALNAFCKKYDTKISYVKPHGALYNDMMKDKTIFEAILKAIKSFDESLMLMILSTTQNSEFEKIAGEYGIGLLYEAFLDRNYTNDGSLVPRSKKDAVIHDVDVVLNRVKDLKEHGYIKSIDDKKLRFKVDTLCVHGDTKEALEFIKTIKGILK